MAQSKRFRDQLSKPEFAPLSGERLKELLRTVNDKTLKPAERDKAKNRLLLAHVRLIYKKVFDDTGGRVGIEDRQTELLDSAVCYLKKRLSQMADIAESTGMSLSTLVCTRLKGWRGDKLRRSQTQKRGKDFKRRAMVADSDAGYDIPADEQLLRSETLEQIEDEVGRALADLEPLEQAVIICRYYDGSDELSFGEVAELLGQTLDAVKNAYSRVKYKWGKQLAHLDPGREDL